MQKYLFILNGPNLMSKKKIIKGKTCVNVSHRLSSIIDSDLILVLDQGKLMEKGNHQELIKLKGKYYTLYNYSEI